MTTTVSQAVAKQENTPSAAVARYKSDFAMVLPATFKPDTFVRLAQGALRQNAKLREAAEANPGSLLVALLECARLGHEPATDEFYLVPRKTRQGPSVQGIEGYKGVVKRMFKSGMVESVVAEAVYDNDEFIWNPGDMSTPKHSPRNGNWFADRGQCVGAYAYAVLKGGSVSKVVVIGEKRINRALSASDGATSDYSPWKRDYEKMVVKTALHDLEPYVPKSAEFIAMDANTRTQVADLINEHELPPPIEDTIDEETGEVVEAEIVT
jgi:recombination protein RecT